jgi:hypothetical protein
MVFRFLGLVVPDTKTEAVSFRNVVIIVMYGDDGQSPC